jgi:hypothetical protein
MIIQQSIFPNKMNHLPEVLFRLIHTFLSNDDYHYLLNTSKRLFEDLKRKTIYFPLNVATSITYLQDEDFQRLLLSKVENGWEQIGVHFSRRRRDFAGKEIPPDLPIHQIAEVEKLPPEQWNNYKSIKFFGKSQCFIPSIPNVRELSLPSNDKFFDFTPCQSLSKLSISDRHRKRCFVEDITPLSKIPHLTVGSLVNVTDFSMLYSQTYLKIFDCDGLTDVTSFRFIRQLTLMECHNITDVSALNGVYDLTLDDCQGVEDITRLGNHHRLVLSSLNENVTDFNCLLHIPHVSVEDCSILDLNVLRYATSVRIALLEELCDVRALKNVKKVEIYYIVGTIVGLEELRDVPDLAYYFTGRTDVSCVQNERLSLYNPSLQITGLSVFSIKIKHLTISMSEVFAKFVNEGQGSLLGHLTSLTLDTLPVKSLQGFRDIPTVSLRYCDSLQSLDGLGGNRCVEVRNCDSLEDVSSVSTVTIVTIEGCSKLTEKSYECLKKVPRLKRF